MSDGKIVIDIEAEGDAAVRELNDVERAAADIQGGTKKASAGIGDMVKAMGLVKIASAAFNVLKSSMGAAISRFDTMQKYPKVMQSLGYSADDSSKSIDKLSNGIDGLPTKLDDIVATNQRMVSISGNIDKATDATVALNNAFLASGASTDDAARGMDQYIKMLSTGKVEADNWDTLMETMPVSLTKVANAMGYMGNDAMVQLKKGLQDGNITFDQFQDKIIELGTGTGELAKLAKVNSEGIGTSFGNLKNTISKNMGNIITKVDEITQKLTGKTIAGNIDSLKYLINAAFASIIKSMDNIIPTIEKISKFVKDNATAFKILGGVIVSAVVAFVAFKTVTGVITSVTNAVQGLRTGFTLLKTALITNPFALVVAAIAALAVAMVYAYQKSETFRKKADGLIATVKGFMAPVKNVIAGINVLGETLVAVLSGNAIPQKLIELRDRFTKLLPEEIFQKFLAFAWKLNDIKLAVKAVVGVLSGSIKNFDDFQEAVFGVFGEKVTKNIFNVVKGIRDFVSSIKNSASSVGKSTKNFDLMGVAFKVLKSVVLGMLGPFGLIIKAIELVAKALGGGDIQKGIKTIMKSFDGLTKGIQANGPLLGKSFGQALEGILAAIGTAIPGIIVGGLQIIAGVIVGIAQGIPLLTVAAIKLIMAFTTAMLTLIPVVGAAGLAIVTSILTEIAKALPQLIVSGANVLLQFIAGLVSVIPQLVTATVDLLVTYIDTVAQNLPRIIASGANLLIKFIEGITKQLPKLAAMTTKLIVTFLNVIAQNIGKVVAAAVNLMVKFVDGLIKKMPQIVSAATRLIVSFLDEISRNLEKIVKAGVNLVVKLVEGIGNNIDKIVKAAGNLVDKLVQGIIDIADRMAKAAVKLINGLADGIRENAELVKRAANNLLDAILEAIPGGSLLKVGKDLASGLADGIGKGIDWVANAAKDLADKAVSSAKKALDIHSPSRVMKNQVGKNIALGVAEGITVYGKTAEDASKNAMKKISDTMNAYKIQYDNGRMSAKSYKANLEAMKKNSGLTATVRNNLNKQIYRIDKDMANKQKSVQSGITKANNQYLKSVKSINSKLNADIKASKVEYNKQLNDLSASIYKQVGLFDAAQKKTISKSTLQANLKGQITQMKEWESNLAKISKTAPKGFVDELREMGLGSANEIAGLATMSNAELKSYVNMWKQKHALAKKEAERQLIDEKKAVDAKIKALTTAANKEIKAAEATWKKQLNALKADAKQVASFKSSGAVLGKNIAQGLINGMKSMNSPIAKTAKNMANRVLKETKKALGIKSPSRKMRDEVGKMIGAGTAIGIDRSAPVAIKSAEGMTDDILRATSRAVGLDRRIKAGFSKLNTGIGKTADLATAAQMITNAVTNNSNSSTKNSNNKAEVNIYTEVKSNTPTERELARQTKVQLRDLGYSFG